MKLGLDSGVFKKMTNKRSRLILPGAQLSQEMINLAQELNDKYPNLNLAWIPPKDRPGNETQPFAIVQLDSSGNTIGIIKRLSQLEVHASFIFNWLWENDSQRMDPWKKYLDDMNKAAVEKRKKEKELNYELAEVVNAVAKSPLHTYRINGHKVGAENEFPTLGLQNASGT
jgi:hypothetical protein